MNLEKENLDLQEQFLELKTHSMKYNLIFTGIPHGGVVPHYIVFVTGFVESPLCYQFQF
jgi:hypothetical protein